MPYVRVALDVPLPHLFDYYCAEAAPSHVGLRVRVPFGARQRIGVILALADSPSVPEDKIRAVREILTDVPALPGDLLELLRFCSDYYHHPIGEVVFAALPTHYRRAALPRATGSITITDAGREALAAGLKRSPKAAQLLARLARDGPLDPEGLRALTLSERQALRRLVASGFACRSAPAFARQQPVAAASPAVELTSEQRAAVEAIAAAGGFRTFLLHGVTGSGKTEVYLAAMARVLEAGRQVLFLVPEIALTPQLEAGIRARFPQAALVTLHSGLAPARRARHWEAAHSGEARIVLGTRSAIFAPLPELGLIVVDEEHDASYKQNESVRYSARDLAVWRARHRNVPIVLGSATPSLESHFAAARGRYTLLRLTRRANAAPLPRVALVPEPARGDVGIAPQIVDAIRSRIDRREQVLVFINRRGYAPVLLCPACAWAPSCPRCAVHTVLHKSRARMSCHHCGRDDPVPLHCAACGNADLRPIGFGTQRIEAALQAALPEARLLRVDRDTVRGRDAWPHMRRAIAAREVDVLVGTQLLAKGHDFPGISLVCVLNADRSLYSTDFRAAEHLFAQLMQVSGRAGRGDEPGEVLIQTAFPSHPLYAAVCAHDYDDFAALLLEERRQAGLPPFVHQALLRAEAPRMAQAIEFLQQAAALATPLAEHIVVYDPTPAAMPRLQGRERAQLLVQSEFRPALHRFLDRWCEALWNGRASGARWVLDVDPLEI